MNSALVKIDVAAAFTGKTISALFDMADGATLLDESLMWVFDLANGDQDARRDLRFWLPELQAINGQRKQLSELEIDQVIARILPKSRANFHAGEVDQLFQIRPRTRIDFAELNGAMKSGRNFYSRVALAEFLKRRWLNAGRAQNNGHNAVISPRATARKADTNKAEPILHAGHPL